MGQGVVMGAQLRARGFSVVEMRVPPPIELDFALAVVFV